MTKQTYRCSWVLGGAFLIAACSTGFSAVQLEDFGYGRMKVGGVEARGARPLVIVLQQFDSAPAAGINGKAPALRDASEFDDLMFNYFKKSANGHFLENSRGRFYWTRAGGGTYGPFLHSGDQFDNEDLNYRKSLKRLDLALQDLASAGFNFANYDANSDGVVTSNELTVMVIDNISGRSGGNRPPKTPCFNPQGQNVKVCLSKMITLGDHSSLMTFTHELSHQLGTIEMYGTNGNANFEYTLMGATIFPVDDDRRTFHLDPWHKMMLGWVEPAVYSMDAPGTATIGASQLPQGAPPIILYSPAHGTHEFFMLEFRSATLPGGAGYDANVNGVGIVPAATATGLVVWHIKTNGIGGEDVNADVSAIPFYDAPGALMISAFMNGSPNFSGGRGGVWNPGAVIPYSLKWLDGSGGEVRIKVGNLTADKKSLPVSWGEFPDAVPPLPNQKLLFYNSTNNTGVTGIIDDADATVKTLQRCTPTAFGGWSHVVSGGSDLFFYQDSTGAAALGKLDAAGNCSLTRVFRPFTFGLGWTHIVYHKGYYFFYNQWNGTAAVGAFESGLFHQYNSWNSFSTGWTKIVSTSNGILFYNATSGSGAVGEWSLVRSGLGFGAIVGVNFTQLNGYDPYSFATGWTHIVNTSNGVLFYNSGTGLHVMADLNPGGIVATRADSVQTLESGWTSIVSDGNNLLFYNSGTGDAAVGFIQKFSILTVDLSGRPSTAGTLGIRSHLSGFSTGWTAIVAAADDKF